MVPQVFKEPACSGWRLHTLCVAPREVQGLWDSFHGSLMGKPCVTDIRFWNVSENQAVGVRPVQNPPQNKGQFEALGRQLTWRSRSLDGQSLPVRPLSWHTAQVEQFMATYKTFGEKC